jgi:sugar phosphate isomerase/epimerase
MKFALTATPSQARFAPILLRGHVADAFEMASELGYDGVELHLRQPGDINRAAVEQLMADHGLQVPALGTGMAAGEDGLTFADADPDIRRRAVQRIKEQVDLAASLNAAVCIGLIRGAAGSDESKHALVLRHTEECCHAAHDMGVTLLVEPINRYETNYVNTVEDALDMVSRIGAPNLKLLIDTFHMNIEEVDIASAVRHAGPHLGYVHLVDSNRQAPGHGHTDFQSVLQALMDVDYNGYLSFETLPLPNPRQAAEDAIHTVRGILATL